MNNTVISQSALSLAEFKTETGQVLTAETVKNYLVSLMEVWIIEKVA